MALTIKEIENAKPKVKKYKMLDGGGLSMLVLPTGTKLWLWRYQFSGSEKNMTFGEYLSSESTACTFFHSLHHVNV